MGPYVSRLLASTGDIGVVTFARFYGMHVLLLPPATFLLIGLHVYLVRRHGVTPIPDDEARPKKKFYPGQVFKDTVAVFIAFAILFVMAIAVRVPLERMADPTDTSYIPRPEWYFLFLFQTLKAFEGPLEVVGTVVLPTLGILLLVLTPFLDRGRIVRFRQRTTAIAVVLLAAIGWGGLTLAAVRSTPPQSEADKLDFSGPTQWMQLKPAELAGISYFRMENCANCHNVVGDTPKRGPNLSNTARRHDAAWMLAHFKDPASVSPGTVMTPVTLEESQLKDLVSFVMVLTGENADVMSAPAFAVDGAALYEQSNCSACHSIDGAGGKIGPVLNGLSSRRTESWVTEHFLNPQKLSPGTPMPPYHFNQTEMQNIVSYLFTLPDNPVTP
jgi:ubiquinol-cytochrome c reductase cytochrome b subunit